MGNSELWIRPVRHGFRGSGHYRTDWKRFCRQVFNTEYTDTETQQYNIDHLFPTVTAVDQGFEFARIMPVCKEANQAVGREIETAWSRRGGLGAGSSTGRISRWRSSLG